MAIEGIRASSPREEPELRTHDHTSQLMQPRPRCTSSLSAVERRGGSPGRSGDDGRVVDGGRGARIRVGRVMTTTVLGVDGVDVQDLRGRCRRCCPARSSVPAGGGTLELGDGRRRSSPRDATTEAAATVRSPDAGIARRAEVIDASVFRSRRRYWPSDVDRLSPARSARRAGPGGPRRILNEALQSAPRRNSGSRGASPPSPAHGTVAARETLLGDEFPHTGRGRDLRRLRGDESATRAFGARRTARWPSSTDAVPPPRPFRGDACGAPGKRSRWPRMLEKSQPGEWSTLIRSRPRYRSSRRSCSKRRSAATSSRGRSSSGSAAGAPRGCRSRGRDPPPDARPRVSMSPAPGTSSATLEPLPASTSSSWRRAPRCARRTPGAAR